MRTIDIDVLRRKLYRAYPDIRMVSDGECLTIFEDFPEDRTGLKVADYWAEGSDYELGVKTHFINFLERNGWYAEWINPEALAIHTI